MLCRTKDGCLQPANVLSIFHEECIKADSKAFKSMMQHLKEVDVHKTVIMVQVENEVGLLGDSRDNSLTASNLFHSEVPSELVDFLALNWPSLLPDLRKKFPLFERSTAQCGKASRTWEELFGPSVYTDELFMAYHFAQFLEKVATAGREAYEIPLFTNAWLPKPGPDGGMGNFASGGNYPGDYPSGGPVSTVLDIWHKFAPTLDFISPDIYTADYTKTCSDYSHNGQLLFIPEQRRDGHGARRIWEALGSFQALGACPFGIDTLTATDCEYTKHYKLLASVSSHILKARLQPNTLTGFYFDQPDPTGRDVYLPITKRFENFELRISRSFVLGKQGPGYGIIIELEVGRYLLIGGGYKVEFESTLPTSVYTGILHFHEMSSLDQGTGILRKERSLNGDETRSGMWANMPSENPDYGDGFIPITIPALTMLAEVQVYSLDQNDIID
jgi:hypothetical protein